MNAHFILILILISLIQVELIEINNITYIQKSSENQEKYTVPEVIELNDSNIDSIIKDGIYNRWLILCYLETCYHCERARQVLNDILESGNYPIINNIKFAQIEVQKNIKSNIRFNISKVPYTILVENNTMYELELYPSEKNLLNFIGTDFRNVTKDIMPFPHMNIFKYYYAIFDNSVSEIVKEVGASQSLVSHQLQVLRNANLVSYRKVGTSVFYSLDDEHVSQLISVVREHVEEKLK